MLRKSCRLQADGRTDGQTDGQCEATIFPSTSLGDGIMKEGKDKLLLYSIEVLNKSSPVIDQSRCEFN